MTRVAVCTAIYTQAFVAETANQPDSNVTAICV